MHRRAHVLAAGVLVLGVCSVAAPAGADRANDQQIADNAVLTSDDVPGFEPHTTADAPLPDSAECRGLERARRQLEAAPNKEVEFRPASEEQVVSNQVSVLSSPKRAKQVLQAYRNPKAASCLDAAFGNGTAGPANGIDVAVEVTPTSLQSGDAAAAYDLTVTATKAGESQQIFTTVAVARVGRAIAAFGIGDASGPVPGDVSTGLIDLVTQRLQEAL
jgi:hypothetical protein